MSRAPLAPTGERFVEATLELIVEQGGSLEVNLRQISRRIGCAHTNVYNYFPRFEDLRWAAFRRALAHYGGGITDGLGASMPPRDYVRRVVSNLAAYPQCHIGLYRFIGSDPIEIERVPADILATVVQMKAWLSDVILTACGTVGPIEAKHVADIVLAYIDGETLNIINGRVIPEEHTEARIVDNAMRLLDVLTDGGPNAIEAGRSMPDPAAILGPQPEPAP